MILWTIQTERAWSQLCDTGTLRTDTALMQSEHGELWEFNKEPYEWLAREMARRVCGRPAPDAFPLWGWYQFDGPNKKRPDLRQRGFVAQGERAVRIEFAIADQDVLLSDFELWHIPLGRQYLAKTAKEDSAWERMMRSRGLWYCQTLSALPPEVRDQIEKSWELIFDFNFRSRYCGASPRMKRIQANFWELSLGQVRHVTHFTGR